MKRALRPELIALGPAMAVVAVGLIWAGRGFEFHGDEIFYYAELASRDGLVVPLSGLEYFLAPHNGHLVLTGRLIYRAFFAVFGTDYAAFRALAVACYLAVAALLFVLVRRRTTPWVALAFTLSILTLGYAYETMLWPFDIHTSLALALGLGALLALERKDRAGDVAACAMLVVATTLIELGLCFAVGAAVLVLLGENRLRRSWIFAAPIVLYAAWYSWAQSFGQSETHLSSVPQIPGDLLTALSAVIGSLLGFNPTGGEAPFLTGTTALGTVLACLAILALLWRLSRGNVPDTLWASLAVLVAYWVTIALGERDPDASRYILVGAVLVLLVAAEALRGVRLPTWIVLVFFLLVALALPGKFEKLRDGRASIEPISSVTGTEYGILDFTRGRVAPNFFPAGDRRVQAVGGELFVALLAHDYFRAADKYGSLGYSLKEIRGEDFRYRRIADAALLAAYDLKLDFVPPPPGAGRCGALPPVSPGSDVFFKLPPGGAALRTTGDKPVNVRLFRFAPGQGVKVGTIPPRLWVELKIPRDSAPEVWKAVVDRSVYVCPLG